MSAQSSKSEAMRVGGRALARVKHQLQSQTHVGTRYEEIESLAQSLIAAEGMSPSFSTVPGYHWASCVMKNDALCHGIPRHNQVQDGDLLTIDVGLINQGYHLDTTISFAVGKQKASVRRFLEVGEQSLRAAIATVKPGQTVYAISRAMEKIVSRHGYGVVYQLTGHGVGEQLHMSPTIPCVAEPRDKHVLVTEGQTLAIEIMYTMGSPDLVIDADKWTYRTADGSLSAMFEETVLVNAQGVEVLTNES